MIKSTKKCQNHTISALNGVPGRSRTVDVQLRRLTLYPTEVRGLIHDLDKYAVYMRDLGMNDLLLRRQILNPAEVRRLIIIWINMQRIYAIVDWSWNVCFSVGMECFYICIQDAGFFGMPISPISISQKARFVKRFLSGRS